MNKERDERAEALVEAISRQLNVLGDESTIAAAVHGLECIHRTLQQGFTRLVVAWLRSLSRRCIEGQYDLRNEASCRLAYRLVGDLDDADLYLPLI